MKREKKIKNYLSELIKSENNITFYCGGYGYFDNLCASICKELQSEKGRIKIAFITPYITIEYQSKIQGLLNSGMYDCVIYPPIEKVPLKFAISKRNEWMISQSDLVVAFVKRTYGGAYKSLQFANRKKKNVINFA